MLPFFLFLIAYTSAFAENGSLADSAVWHSLNYYERSGGGYVSEITNADYFLAANGRGSPGDEYQALTQAIRTFRDEGKGLDILCAFPARLSFVVANDPEFKGFEQPVCQEYLSQNDPKRIKSISLVFASGYFDSPASYFGHTMLRFDTDKKNVEHYTFTSSLNYGAKITDSTANPMYVVNGLTGGYVASYNTDNELINTHNYTNNQMRDVWVYKLNLTPDQRRFIVEHAWELRRARFKYYFLNDNCAHRIARLVDMATGSSISKAKRSWLLPINVIQAAHSASGDLVQEETHYPALTGKLRCRYSILQTREKNEFVSFFKSLPSKQKALLPRLSSGALPLILTELDIRLADLAGREDDDAKKPQLQAQRRMVLAELLRRPASEVTPVHTADTSSRAVLTPATAQKSSMLQIGYIFREGGGATQLRYQAANNDLLTPRVEGQEPSQFIMGAIDLEASRSDLNVHRLTLFDIKSLNPSPIPVEVSNEYSWGFGLGYGPQNEICDKCSSIYVNASVGLASRPTSDLVLYTLVGPQLSHQRGRQHDYLMLRAEQGALYELSGSARLQGFFAADVSPMRGNPNWLAHAALAYELTPQRQLRLLAEHDGTEGVLAVKFGVFFN